MELEWEELTSNGIPYRHVLYMQQEGSNRRQMVAYVTNEVTYWSTYAGQGRVLRFKTKEEAMAMAIALIRLD